MLQPFKEHKMHIKPIKTVQDNEMALVRIDQLWDAEPNTEKGDELEVLATLVHAFEEQHYPIKTPDPIDAIKFRMEQQSLERDDLIPFLGQRSRVSEILNRKRGLSITMIRKLHKGLKIPLECLFKDYDLAV